MTKIIEVDLSVILIQVVFNLTKFINDLFPRSIFLNHDFLNEVVKTPWINQESIFSKFQLLLKRHFIGFVFIVKDLLFRFHIVLFGLTFEPLHIRYFILKLSIILNLYLTFQF